MSATNDFARAQGDYGMDAETPQRPENQTRIDAQALAFRLKAELDEALQARKMAELRWLDNLCQYRGIYDANTARRLKKRKRSSVFYRITTNKINTMVARLMDLLFPQRLKNWSIDPTPDPQLPYEIIASDLADEIGPAAEAIFQKRINELAAQNVCPDELAAQKLRAEARRQAAEAANTPQARIRIARQRATAMERVIDDQIKENCVNGQRRPSWQQNCREVIKSACIYGMGVLKGPLCEETEVRRFIPKRDENGAAVWAESVVSSGFRPFHEHVSIWDIFPDPGARTPEELRYVWQLHLMIDKDVLDLAKMPGFDGEAIRKYLRDNPDGDAKLSDWESQLRQLNDDNLSFGADLRNRYRVYERWGFLSGRDLQATGIEIDRTESVYSVCVWMLGEKIIKASVNPLEGVDIPYYFYPFQRDETGFWPEGMADALKAPQAAINAAVRALMDNAAASAGPIYGVNLANLDPSEDPREMEANRMFFFDKSGVDIGQVFQAVTVPSCIEHNLGLAQFWQSAADEVSLPRYTAGDGAARGAGVTASGLSMLMGAANVMLKDHVKDFDDCIVAPFIRAMFRWNMKWNVREDIKGDFEAVASVSQSLIAKEVRLQQAPMLVQYMAIPQFAPYIRPDKLLEVILEQTDLPCERILRSEEEAGQFIREQETSAARATGTTLTSAGI